jgi:hypothetical protein
VVIVSTVTFVLSTMPELAGMEELGVLLKRDSSIRLLTLVPSWQAWKNLKFLFKRDSGMRFLTFVLSTMPELAGMEELEFYLKGIVA